MQEERIVAHDQAQLYSSVYTLIRAIYDVGGMNKVGDFLPGNTWRLEMIGKSKKNTIGRLLALTIISLTLISQALAEDLIYFTRDEPLLQTRDCGLDGGEAVSLTQGGQYVRHQGWQLKPLAEPKTELEISDATFCIKAISGNRFKIQGRLVRDDGKSVKGNYLAKDGKDVQRSFEDAHDFEVFNAPAIGIVTLLPSGPEGQRQTNEAKSEDGIIVEVLFVDWGGEKPSVEDEFDKLWSTLTSNGELKSALERQGLTVTINLNRSWEKMPKSLSTYFPPKTDPGHWLWEEYTNDSVALLGTGKTYTPNTIAVIVPRQDIPGFKEVVSGAHTITSFRGIRRLITVVPDAYNEHYTTLMHEIGHTFGSGELYPSSGEDHEVGGYDVMGDTVFGTGFLGWHRFRYGWLPKSRNALIKETGQYRVELQKLSASDGLAMLVIQDPSNINKRWAVEIAQDVQSRAQFKNGNNEKLNSEGDRIIVYSVETPEVAGKRAIRVQPQNTFPASYPNKSTNSDSDMVDWLDKMSLKAGEVMDHPADVPFTVKVVSTSADGSSTVDVELR